MSSPAAPSGGEERGTRAGIGRTRARLEGLAVLAILAFTGLALWRLSDFAEPAVRIDWSPCGANGALAILTGGAPPAPGSPPDARAIISRVPIAFDGKHSVLIILEPRSRRVVPADAALVLAGDDGKVEAFRAHGIPSSVLEMLRVLAPSSRYQTLRAWLADPQRPRTPLEEPLRRLLDV